MALVTAIANAAGRTIYRKAGRFISESQFNRESQAVTTAARGVGRAFKSAGTTQQVGLAARIMNAVGPPIGGGDWVSRVRKSGERFAELLGEEGELV